MVGIGVQENPAMFCACASMSANDVRTFVKQECANQFEIAGFVFCHLQSMMHNSGCSYKHFTS